MSITQQPQYKTTIEERMQGFNDWMIKCRNTYYADNEKMVLAYERIE